jgi:hypothetical protein
VGCSTAGEILDRRVADGGMSVAVARFAHTACDALTLASRPRPTRGPAAPVVDSVFDASGKHFYVSIQHNVTGTGTILDITGWK